MEMINRALGLLLATACAAGVASLPQQADAAGIDSTVNHRSLHDGAVRLELFDGKAEQGNPAYVLLGGDYGRARLWIENISTPTKATCSVGKGKPGDKLTKTFTVEEHYRKASKMYATGMTLSMTAGSYKKLEFIVTPTPAGTYVYDIEGSPLGNSSFVECTVKTLGSQAANPRRGSAASARAGTRPGPAARASRSGEAAVTTARISGTRTLKRLNRRQEQTRGFERRPRRAPRTAAGPASHSFGAWNFVSDSKKAMLLRSEFASLTASGLALTATDSVAATVQIPSGKSAVLDCEIEVGDFVEPDFAVSVKHAGGPTTTHTFLPGVRHLVFGVSPMVGLETLFLQGNGAETGRWVLRSCEVSFH